MFDKKYVQNLLQTEEYGFIPAAPENVSVNIIAEEEAFAGKAKLQTIMLKAKTAHGEVTFPFKYCYLK